MRVLVTGGAGFIGGITSKLLLDAGYKVVVIDDLSTGHLESLDERATFVRGDILDREAVEFALQRCEIIMHFAAKALVAESVENPDLYHHVNVEGSRVLFQAAKRLGVKRVVLSSSCATYGSPQAIPITETAPTRPINPYGESKLEVDRLMSELANSNGFAAMSLRYFNVAGALSRGSEWLSEKHEVETHLIPNVLRSTQKDPLEVFGTDFPTHDGTCVRDYVHVADIARAHLLAVGKLMEGHHQIVNLGSGKGFSVKEVLDTAEGVLDRTIPRRYVSRRSGDPAVLIASNERAKEILDWSPEFSLKQMIIDAATAENLI